MTVMTAVICLSSHTCLGQRWGGGWGAARRWNFRTPYTIPFAEPEPEPEPFTRRLSRRLIDRRRTIQNKIQNMVITTTTTPTLTTTQRLSTVTTPPRTILPERRKNLLKLLDESFPTSAPTEDLQLDEIFSESSAPNPWTIDTAQFEIVPAVPSKETPDILRVAKELSKDNRKEKDVYTIAPVLRQFSPVPAVPDVTTSPDDGLVRQPKNTQDLSDNIDNSLEKQKDVNKKGMCAERCVQQFCLSEEDLSMFSTCVDKCKTFCL